MAPLNLESDRDAKLVWITVWQALPYLANEESLQNEVAWTTESLESIYVACLHRSDSIFDKEQARELRVRLCLLESEVQELHDHLADKDGHITNFDSAMEAAEQELRVSRQRLKATDGEMRLKSREVENLKVGKQRQIDETLLNLLQIELQSLRDLTMDSTKLLTEKLSLSRELSALKPELDYFRSQAATQQSLLTENFKLQQQCMTLGAELENSRKSVERPNSTELRAQKDDVSCQNRLEALQLDIAAERVKRQRVEQEFVQSSAESEAKNELLVSRLDAFRKKLKSTKDQLKEAQEVVKLAQKPNREFRDIKSSDKIGLGLKGDGYGRRATLVENDTSIGTPGDAVKGSSTLPGDKSMFSTTPFLNRTLNVAPASPDSDCAHGLKDSMNEQEIPRARQVVVEAATAPLVHSVGRLSQKPGKPFASSKWRKSSIGSWRQTEFDLKHASTDTALNVLAEEEDGQAEDQDDVGDNTLTMEANRKRRKLLINTMANTSLNEEEIELTPVKRSMGSYNRPMKFLGRNNSSTGVGALKLAAFGSTLVGGEFSPLKRNRRG